MPMSKLEEIRKILESCDQDELGEVRQLVDEAGSLVQLVSLELGTAQPTNMRNEQRIPYDAEAEVTRVTDIKSGERVKYTASLKDVSRSGLCLQIEGHFIPSRLIKVFFSTPVGKNKEVVVEVVRIKEDVTGPGENDITEVGCKSIGYQDANKIIIKDNKIREIRRSINNREQVLVLLVSDKASDVDDKIYKRLRRDGFNVKKMFSIHQALTSAAKTNAQLTILCNGTKLRYDKDFTSQFRYRAESLASIAVVDNEDDRRMLTRAGIDECITPEAIDNFLEDAVESAIVSHRLKGQDRVNKHQVLLVGGDSLSQNTVKDTLAGCGYGMVFCKNSALSECYGIEEFEVVFAFYDPDNPLEFMRVLELYYSNIVIAIAENPLNGREALVRGATDYICTPIDKEAIVAALDSSRDRKRI